ncbi:hypothetical protein VTI74DRAFT_1897 [Chaetomium olivicolor]
MDSGLIGHIDASGQFELDLGSVPGMVAHFGKLWVATSHQHPPESPDLFLGPSAPLISCDLELEALKTPDVATRREITTPRRRWTETAHCLRDFRVVHRGAVTLHCPLLVDFCLGRCRSCGITVSFVSWPALASCLWPLSREMSMETISTFRQTL